MSDNVKFMPQSNANGVVDKLFESFRSRHQLNLKTSMKESNFIFYLIQLTYCKCLKVTSIPSSSYIDITKQIKKKIINPNSADDKCFRNVVAAT